jgi:glycosyltransferase involved in cell wall biosynthesis
MSTGAMRVSVVIPAFNAAWCVGRAVDSALAQHYSEREVIVVDDGSTDTTAEVLARYGAAIRVVPRSNGGLSRARNAGIRAATGALVAFLDADDYWLPTKLSQQVALLDSLPGIGFCSTGAALEAPDGTRLGEWACARAADNMLREIFAHNAAVAGSGSAVLARRELFERAGMFDESLKSLEDIDMWMRLAAITGYACVPEPLTVVLRSHDSMSRNLDVMRASAIRVLRKNRHLLAASEQGAFWQACYATMLADYAKWEYRVGRRRAAISHLCEGMLRAPFARGRLMLGLMVAMVTGERI